MIAKTLFYSEERERCVSIKKLRNTSRPTNESPPPSYNAAITSPTPEKKELPSIKERWDAWKHRFDPCVSGPLGAVGGAGMATACLTNPVGWAGLAVAGGFTAGYVAVNYLISGGK